MIVLVCGGRDHSSEYLVHMELSMLHRASRIDLIIEGGCPTGVDRFARSWCLAKGVHNATVDAMWHNFKRAAGPMRNAAMLLLKPDLVLAFDGNTGTQDMVEKALAAGVKVLRK